MDVTEMKQNYLRTQILDQGYDPNEFIGFLVSKKGENAADIDTWDFYDLKQVVNEYISMHSNQDQQNNPPQDYNNEEQNQYQNQYQDQNNPPQEYNNEGQNQYQNDYNNNQDQNQNQYQNEIPQNNNNVPPQNVHPEIQVQEPVQESVAPESPKNEPNKNLTDDTQLSPTKEDKEIEDKFEEALRKQREIDNKKKAKEQEAAMRKKKMLEEQLKKEEEENKKKLLLKQQRVEQNQRQHFIQNASSSPSKKQPMFASLGSSSNKPVSSNNNKFQDDEIEIENTVTSESSPLTKFNPCSITIDSPEKVEGGLFAKSFISYLVKTDDLDKRVRRKFSDFEWLREQLAKYYPASVVSSLGNDSSEKFSEDFIEMRMRILRKFIDSILADPLLKRSNIFYEFLSVVEEKQFNVKKVGYSKGKAPVNLSSMKTPNGKARVNVSSSRETYFQNIKDYENISETIYQKLIDNFNYLNDEVTAVINRLSEMSKIFNELHQNSIKYLDNKNISQCYRLLTNLTKQWSDSQKKILDITNIEVKEYFKFIKYRFAPMKELIYKVDSHKNNYHRSDERLKSKKNELFITGNTAKWEVENKVIEKMNLTNNRDLAFEKMLPKETEAVNSIKKEYGYYINMIISEYERLRFVDGNNDNKMLYSYCQHYYDIMNDLTKTVNEIIASTKTSVSLENNNNIRNKFFPSKK